MTEFMQAPDDAWREFNSGDANEDPAGGLLYALRYDQSDLSSHQSEVIEQIKAEGMRMMELPDGSLVICGDMDEIADDARERLMLLTEELTVTNEALEHNSSGINNSETLESLAQKYKVAFLMAVGSGQQNIAGALIQQEMPRLISELERAQFENQPLSEEEYSTLQEWREFVASKIGHVRDGDPLVLISSDGPPQFFSEHDLEF